MFNNFIDYIAKCDREKIVGLQRNIKKFYYFYGVVFAVVFIRAIITNTTYLLIFFICLTVVVMAFYIISNFLIQMGINRILTYELLPIKFLEIMEVSSSYKNGSKTMLDKANYFLGKSLSYHSLGDFSESDKALRELDVERLQGLQKVQWHFLQSLNQYFQTGDIDASSFKNKINEVVVKKEKSRLIISDRIKMLNGIEKLSKNITDNYFDENHFESNFGRIQILYFRAQNQLLQGNKNKAKSIFQTIATENPELFYVQEAKQYLEEN